MWGDAFRTQKQVVITFNLKPIFNFIFELSWSAETFQSNYKPVWTMEAGEGSKTLAMSSPWWNGIFLMVNCHKGLCLCSLLVVCKSFQTLCLQKSLLTYSYYSSGIFPFTGLTQPQKQFSFNRGLDFPNRTMLDSPTKILGYHLGFPSNLSPPDNYGF